MPYERKVIPYEGRRNCHKQLYPPSRPTPADFAALAKMSYDGASGDEIAVELRVANCTVNRWRRQFNLPRKRPGGYTAE